MTLLGIAWRYLWGRPAITLLLLAAVALGSGLVSAVLTLARESRNAFEAEAALFDIAVGAKGSPLQLILSSVYHIDVPTGNVPYDVYTNLLADSRVARAVPLGLGDNYRGFRIVGSDASLFELARDPRAAEPGPLLRVATGRVYTAPFEVVLGAGLPEATGLAIGDRFVGTHGFVTVPGSEEHDEFPYEVVGILERTGTSVDRAIYTPIESVWEVHDAEDARHAALFAPEGEEEDRDDGGEADNEEDDGGWGYFARAAGATGRERPREVTAVLLQLTSPGWRFVLREEIQDSTNAMAAIPLMEMHRLYERVLRPLRQAMVAVAGLVVLVAALSILTTMLQSAERRRRDLALLRSLGARAWEIFALVVLEAVFLSVLGVLAGAALGHGVLALFANALADRAGIAINAWSLSSGEVTALAVVALAGTLAGVVPAALAYRRPAHSDLALDV